MIQSELLMQSCYTFYLLSELPDSSFQKGTLATLLFPYLVCSDFPHQKISLISFSYDPHPHPQLLILFECMMYALGC